MLLASRESTLSVVIVLLLYKRVCVMVGEMSGNMFESSNVLSLTLASRPAIHVLCCYCRE